MKKLLFVLLLLIIGQNLWAQITPTNPVAQGKEETYYFNDGTNYIYPEWSAVNGTVLSSAIDGTLHSAVIRWSSTATQGTIYLRDLIGEEGAPIYVGIANLSISLYTCSISPPIVSTYSKCGLGVVELTATPGNGGDNIHWFNQYGQSQIVSSNYTTPSLNSYSTYTFYATSVRSSDGCESSPPTPVTVMVKQVPTAAASRVTQENCSGTVINPIFLSNPNGVAGTTFSWTFQDPSGLVTGGSAGVGGTISQTLSLSGSSPTTVAYTITPSAGGCNGSAVTSSVTINPSATTPTITGNKRFGPGSLTVVAGASGIYNWYNADGFEISDTHAPNFNTIEFSDSEAIYTNYLAVEKVSDKGCKSAKVNVDVHIKRLPTITPSANRLPENGSPIIITADVGYDTYSWIKDGIPMGQYSRILSTNQPGIYKVSVTLAGTSDYGDSPTVKILDPYTGLISGAAAIFTNTPATYSFKAEYTLTDPEWRLTDGTYLGTGTSANGYYYMTVNFPLTGNKYLRIQERLENASGVYYNILDTKGIVVNPCPTIVPGAVLSPGTTYCQNGAPVNITMTNPSGGNGSYTYQWMQSDNGSSWINAAGVSTNSSYTAPVASVTMYYKRVVTSCANAVSEGVVVLSPPAVAGTVSGSRENYGPMSGSVSVSGHQGTIEKWQKRELDGGWQDVLSTNNNLSYSDISKDTRFKARIASGVCPVLETNEVLLKVYPLPQMQTNGPIAIAPGEKTSISVLNDFNTYQWYRNDNVISGATGKVLSVSMPGTYKLTVRAAGASFTYTPSSIIISEKNSLDQNFVKTIDFNKPGIDVTADVFQLQPVDYTINTSYFDGLGRPLQSVSLGAASHGGDLIQPIAYDAYGREAKKYLPYANSSRDGRYQPTALANQQTFYNNGSTAVAQDAKPYSETIFEPSPLNRVVKQGAPGTDWQPDANHSYASTDHTVKFAYEFNEANEVRLWKYSYPNPVSTTGTISSYGRYYLPNQLFKNKTKDEQQREVITYIDKEGKTILKRVQAKDNPSSINDEDYASTYYVYDDFGNLVYVVPPEANKILKSSSNFAAPTTWVGGSSGLSFQPTLITKTSLTPGYNAGAFSTGSILVNQAGWIKMTAYETNTSRMMGLSAVNAGNNNTMEFAIELASDAHIYVWEDGIKLDDLGLYSQGTEVMILREAGSTAIKYFVNNTVKKISAKTSANRLYIDLAIDHPGGTIQELEILPAGDKTIIGNYAFSYVYDARKRMIIKKVPDSNPVYMIYDKRDRLVMTQDGNQRSSKRWTFTKYDALNRPVLTGIHTADIVLSVAEMQKRVDDYYKAVPGNGGAWYESFNTSNPIHGYDNKSFPVETNANNYLTATYYDSYDIQGAWGGDYQYSDLDLEATSNGESYPQPNTFNNGVKGLVTASKTKVLDGGVTGGYTWLKSVNYYDEKYRIIQTISDNYKGGTDRNITIYDFVGKPLLTKTYTASYDVAWRDQTNLVLSGNRIASSATKPNAWGDCGAASVQQLPAGQDGWVEFSVFQAHGNIVMGLSDVNSDNNFNTIDYGIYFGGASVVRPYENGVIKYSSPYGIKIGDRLRIERVGTVVRYYQNGILLYTSLTPSTSSLVFDVTMFDKNLTVFNARCSFAKEETSITRRFDYDHAGRLTHTWHSINGANEVLLTHNKYNELGQLIDKKLHSNVADASDAKQSVDYRYNIRGWLTSINNSQLTTDNTNDDAGDYFGMQLAYNTDLGTGNIGALQYNGNISAAKWSNQYGSNSIKENAYNYTYDAMNRLKTADFRQQVRGTWGLAQYRAANGTMQSVNAFSESITNGSASGYDLNGNINFLKRTGQDGQLMDDLSYTYQSGGGNILSRVADAANDIEGFKENNSTVDDYAYDVNGNLVQDRNKVTEESVKNGFFDTGSSEWVLTEPGRLSFVNGRLEITAGAATALVDQVVQLRGSTNYVVELTMVRTSTSGTVTVLVGSNTGAGRTTSTTYLATTGSLDRVGLEISPDFAGYIESISVRTFALITYNYLNLPEKVIKGETESIQYIYTATGQKLAQVLTEGTTTKTTDYAGEYVYENDVLKFIQHEEGRIIPLPEGEGPGGGEYQYHLKDHLGNIRLTFTTKQEVEEVKATLETASENNERANFVKYDDIRKVNSPLFDHTATGTTQYAMRLTGTPAETYGLARSISVMPGDKIKAEVFAKYLDTNPANWTAALTDLVAAIASGGAAPGTVIDGGAYGSPAASSIPFASPVGKSTEPSDIPKAYLNWLVFDKNFVPLASKSGFRRISNAAMENGVLAPEGVLHEKLESPLIEISEPGYVYVYLSNEEPGKEVYFDDFTVTHTKSPVVQSDDYYPFGLTFNSYSRENSTRNKYLYNDGAERQEDLDMNVDATKFRMYDPAMGRWWQVDPLADEWTLISLTPYNYSGNDPVRYNDPEGDCPWCVGALIGFVVEVGSQMAVNAATGKDLTDIDWVDVGTATVVGAATSGLSTMATAGKLSVKGANLLKNTIVASGEIVQAGADGKMENGSFTNKNVINGGKKQTDAAVDLVAGKIVSGGGKKIAEGAGNLLNSSAKTTLNKANQMVKNTATGSKNNVAAKNNVATAKSTIKGNQAIVDKGVAIGSSAAVESPKEKIKDVISN